MAGPGVVAIVTARYLDALSDNVEMAWLLEAEEHSRASAKGYFRLSDIKNQ